MIKKVVNKIKDKFIVLASVLTTGIYFSSASVYASAIQSSVESASKDITGTAQTTIKALATIALIIIAIMIGLGGEKGKQQGKEKAIWLIIGVAVILWIDQIMNVIFGWFGR